MIPKYEFKFWHKKRNEILPVSAWYFETGIISIGNKWDAETLNIKDGVILPIIDGLKSVDGEPLTVGDVFGFDNEKETLEYINFESQFETFVFLPNAADSGHIDFYDLYGNYYAFNYYHVTELKDYFIKQALDEKGNRKNIFTHPDGCEKLFEIMGV